MRLIETLLGIKGQEDAYPAIILSNEGQNIPLYTPVIAEDDMGAKRVTMHFPSAAGHPNRMHIHLTKESLLPLQPKKLIQNRRVKTIDEFEYKKIRKIQEFVREDGAITFIIEDPSAGVVFMKGLNYFKKEFPCTAFCGNNAPGNDKNPCVIGDMLSLAITIYDLRYAIPIFNNKKVSGMAVGVTLLWPKSSEGLNRLAFVNEFHFIVNSFPDNLLFVDGVKLRDRSFVGDMYTSHCISWLDKETARREAETKYLSKARK